MRKAVLLDRDGTINVDYGYLHNPEQLEFLPGVIKALKALCDDGYLLVIITNQSGIGRGFFTQQQYNEFNNVLIERLLANGIEIAATYMCPHAPNEQCSCRKPSGYMAQQAIDSLGIDPRESYMFGDKASDVECGNAVGVTSRLITQQRDLLYWTNEILDKRL